MASAAKLFSFLFFLASLLFSQQAQARESQFFSKVANVNNNNNNYVKETEGPKTETPVKKQEQEPAFIPETQSGYVKETRSPENGKYYYRSNANGKYYYDPNP
ncbi:unnamed protein product [Prunus brigantina]